ncbi:MAG: hypothetical protein IKJ86_03655 [Clostridia bacterium]|nr:hypothetical protein [Clostridia bacterium]
MKRIFFSLISLLLVVSMLTSCSGKKILKTKDIVDNISATNVVLYDFISENEEFNEFSKMFTSSYTTPGLYEGIIPQGLCYNFNMDWIIISGYYEDKTFPSMLMVLDAKTGSLLKSVKLQNVDGSMYYVHAGGIASSGSYIFVTSDYSARTIAIETLKKAKDGDIVQFTSDFKINTIGSFVNVYSEILWVGDFIESTPEERSKVENVTTINSGETFYAYCEGYNLKDGLPKIDKINSTRDGYVPDIMLAIPEQVQGMTRTLSGGFIFSTSYGRKNNSVIKVFNDVTEGDKAGTVMVDGVEVDLYACDELETKITYTAPPMSQGIESVNGTIYLLFESGAAKYRQGGGKYPVDTLFKAELTRY